jgi:hypothetical protein
MSALENKTEIIVIDAEGTCANRVGAIRRQQAFFSLMLEYSRISAFSFGGS